MKIFRKKEDQSGFTHTNSRKSLGGFTIIEVMIVLAIAALIMSIVFVAAPALRRSGNNNARNTDAQLIAGAMNECLSNRNGVVGSCNSAGLGSALDPAKLKILTGSTYTAGGTGSTTAASYMYGYKCNADGSAAVASAATTDYAVVYQLEGGAGNVARCIGSS